MRKLLFVPLIAVLMCLGFMPSAQADSTIPNFFKSQGWWNANNPSTNASSPWGTWMYDEFPISCNNGPSNNAFKVILARRADQPVKSNTIGLRKGIAAAASTVTASAQKVLGGTSGVLLKDSLSPRFVTWQNADGECFPVIQEVVYPTTVPKTGDDVYPWLRSNGYFSETNRKYIVLVQDAVPDRPVAGVSYGPINSMPGPTNPANYGGHGLYTNLINDIYAPGNMFNDGWVHTVAHEMVHSLGGVSSAAPHASGAHATDCHDIICSGAPGGATTYVCSPEITSWYNARQTYRLDCNRDDYFNVGNPAWESVRWNIADSSFLWGNPQPPAQSARTRSVQTVIVD